LHDALVAWVLAAPVLQFDRARQHQLAAGSPPRRARPRRPRHHL